MQIESEIDDDEPASIGRLDTSFCGRAALLMGWLVIVWSLNGVALCVMFVTRSHRAPHFVGVVFAGSKCDNAARICALSQFVQVFGFCFVCVFLTKRRACVFTKPHNSPNRAQISI